MGPLHMKFGLLSILVNASQCGMYHAEINLQCYSGPDGSPHLLSSSRISWAESLDVKLQLIRCYLHFFSRWKTRNLATVCGKHLPENCITVQRVGSQKKARQRTNTSVCIASKDLTLFASENEAYVICLLPSWSFADNAKSSLNWIWLAISIKERVLIGTAEFDSGQAWGVRLPKYWRDLEVDHNESFLQQII